MLYLGKACEHVFYPLIHNQPKTYPQPHNNYHKTYPQSYPQHYAYNVAFSHACVLAVYTIARAHDTRHKTSDITKDYIYINIIYHINYKCC